MHERLAGWCYRTCTFSSAINERNRSRFSFESQLFSLLYHTRDGLWQRTMRIQGIFNRTQVGRESLISKSPSLIGPVQRTCSNVRPITKYVGGKFRDLLAKHENNENWHTKKITCHMVSETHVLFVEPFQCHQLGHSVVPYEDIQ